MRPASLPSLFSVLLALLAACARSTSGPSTLELQATLRGLNLAQPGSDAVASINRGDLRPIGINGYTCMPPGTPSETVVRLARTYGLRCLAGTTDALESTHYGELRDQAIAYGTQYNAALERLAGQR